MNRFPPSVTVLMGAYNGETFLGEAVESVLAQTFGDFEFIVFNDGSTDGTREVLNGLKDPRLRVIHQANMGLTATLNRGLDLARGRYIARMDADDLSLPNRFERQLAELNANADLAVVDSAVEWFGDASQVRCMGEAFARLPVELLDGNRLTHGSVMARRDAMRAVGGYDERFRFAQDHDLWLRMAWRGYRFRMINDVLYRLRIHGSAVSSRKRSEQWALSRAARVRIIQGIRSGRYAVPDGMAGPLADTLLTVAHRWLRHGFSEDAREAVRGFRHVHRWNRRAFAIYARSYPCVRPWYDRAARVKAAIGGARA